MPSNNPGTDIKAIAVESSDLTGSVNSNDVGCRLKLLREAQGLSQRELAKLSGVTNSNISMIEQGQVSPSVQSLTRILKAFPMTLAEFFSFELSSIGRYVYKSNELTQKKTLSVSAVVKSLATERVHRQLQMQTHLLPPGLILNVGALARDSDWCGFVIEGDLQLTIGLRLYELSAGDGFYIPRGMQCKMSNLTETSAHIINCSLFSGIT